MYDDEYYGPSAEARARRVRSVVTVVLVLLLVFFATWYALSYLTSDHSSSDDADASPTTPTCEVQADQVKVTVYNAAGREGVAADMRDELKKRGFDVTSIDNAPSPITGRGELRHGPDGAKGAELLGEHLGEVDNVDDGRKDASVDVVVGEDFKELRQEDLAPDC